MNIIVRSQASVTAEIPGMSLKETCDEFAKTYDAILGLMKQELQSLTPRSINHSQYQDFVRVIVSSIKENSGNLQRYVDLRFFLEPSAAYTPSPSDPALFGPNLAQYATRLGRVPGAEQQLFHCLLNGWIMNQCNEVKKILQFMCILRRVMEHQTIANYLLSEFYPALLAVGFGTQGGWVLCHQFLPLLCHYITSNLKLKENSQALGVFNHAINILKMIMNGTLLTYRNFEHDEEGINPNHRGILVTTFEFSEAILPCMFNYCRADIRQFSKFNEIAQSISEYKYFAAQAYAGFSTEVWRHNGLFTVDNGRFAMDFADEIRSEMEKHFQVDDMGFRVRVRGYDITDLGLDERNLGEVLRSGMPVYSEYLQEGEKLLLNHPKSEDSLGSALPVYSEHVPEFREDRDIQEDQSKLVCPEFNPYLTRAH